MSKKTTLLRGLLTKVSSQRTQYKPYSYELAFDEVYTNVAPRVFVEVEVDSEVVVEEGETGDGIKYLVLNLDGLNAILQVTADSIDKLDEAYVNRLMGN
ncbi:MAG TPA: hypothetical protein VIY48_09595 [Candidatus Paceibacterota bacterium]